MSRKVVACGIPKTQERQYTKTPRPSRENRQGGTTREIHGIVFPAQGVAMSEVVHAHVQHSHEQSGRNGANGK